MSCLCDVLVPICCWGCQPELVSPLSSTHHLVLHCHHHRCDVLTGVAGNGQHNDTQEGLAQPRVRTELLYTATQEPASTTWTQTHTYNTPTGLSLDKEVCALCCCPTHTQHRTCIHTHMLPLVMLPPKHSLCPTLSHNTQTHISRARLSASAPRTPTNSL